MIPRLALVAVGKVVGFPSRVRLWTFDAACRHPRETQEALLHEILATHADTAFGRDHGFRDITSAADFRRQIPIAGYDVIEPYVARVRRGETSALLADDRVLMFALTSGTTKARKYVPVTPRYLADYQRGWNRWGLRTLLDHQCISCAPILQLAGDDEEFRTEADIPCGSLSGLTARAQKRYMRFLYCYPSVANTIKDSATKYYVALRLSIARPVGMIVSPNPSTLAGLAKALQSRTEELVRDLHDGTLSANLDLPAGVRELLTPHLKRHKRQATRFDAIARKADGLWPRDVWRPDRLLLGTWTGGSVGPYLQQLSDYYGNTFVRDLGLVASEGRMTIPLEDGTASGVLDVTTHYFEFIPEAEIDSPQPTVIGAHDVEEGKNYFLVPTTAAGLYRYDLHDLVRVTGFHGRTPKVEFLSKGSHFSSLTGEKLSEYQVTRAMAEIAGKMLPVYSLAPCWDDDRPYYGLFVERGATVDAVALDAALQHANDEYRSKRSSHRLGPIRVEWLEPGAWDRWTAARRAKAGGPVEQYKHPCLIGDVGFREAIRARPV
ncbi:MAG: GH3 auxin-responsive promoter family protein [Gemmataceae bacterium]